jgi:hypothetical protein
MWLWGEFSPRLRFALPILILLTSFQSIIISQVQSRVTSYEIRGARNGTRAGFTPDFLLTFHANQHSITDIQCLPITVENCGKPDQAALYHILAL